MSGPVTNIDRPLEIVVINSTPLEGSVDLVRSDPSLLRNLIVRTPAEGAGWGKASDGELMAALDGQRVILANDLSGRSRLRVFD